MAHLLRRLGKDFSTTLVSNRPRIIETRDWPKRSRAYDIMATGYPLMKMLRVQDKDNRI